MYREWKRQAGGWPRGADGALSIDGTTVKILAGDIKDYSSISIINGGVLEICNGPVYDGRDLTLNNGSTPTIIGCSGNCTINTGGMIRAIYNALSDTQLGVGAQTYSKTAPGAVVNPVQFSIGVRLGGPGGRSGDAFADRGSDIGTRGHGGGGGGNTDGANTSGANSWFYSGYGGDSFGGFSGGSQLSAYTDGFGVAGGAGGADNNEGPPYSVGAGGSGGTRGYNGGCFYLQVAGTLSVTGTTFVANGSAGGAGGAGGDATDATSDGYGGGGGGGGSGGSGGKVFIRYKSGSAAAGNVNVTGGSGGAGGAAGLASSPGFAFDGDVGAAGVVGSAGSSDIATY